MLIYPRLAAAVLVTVFAVGGAMYLLGQRNPVGAPVPTSSPAAPSPTPSLDAAASAATAPGSPSVDTTLWLPFTSAFYGFTVAHPGAWTEQPATGHWALATQDDADVDIFWSPTGWPDFKGFSTRVPKGQTADEFIQSYTAGAFGKACFPTPEMWTKTTIDGHPAGIAYAGCNEHFYFAEAIVVIGDRIWFFTLDGPDRSLIVPFLSTVTIDPEAVVD